MPRKIADDEKQRLEKLSETRAPRQDTLMRFYIADCRCDAHFARLSQAWRPVFALLATGQLDEAESSDASIDYERALDSVVSDKFGLADKNGDALDWAKRWVHRHVVHETEHATSQVAQAWGKFSAGEGLPSHPAKSASGWPVW